MTVTLTLTSSTPLLNLKPSCPCRRGRRLPGQRDGSEQARRARPPAGQVATQDARRTMRPHRVDRTCPAGPPMPAGWCAGRRAAARAGGAEARPGSARRWWRSPSATTKGDSCPGPSSSSSTSAVRVRNQMPAGSKTRTSASSLSTGCRRRGCAPAPTPSARRRRGCGPGPPVRAGRIRPGAGGSAGARCGVHDAGGTPSTTANSRHGARPASAATRAAAWRPSPPGTGRAWRARAGPPPPRAGARVEHRRSVTGTRASTSA